MAPLRNTTSTRAARLESTSPPSGSARRHRFDGETEILASEYGQPFLAEYLKSVVPEFHRLPDPNLIRPSEPRAPSLTLKDLDLIRSLGVGAQGMVYLVRAKRKTHPLDKPGACFALKVLRKKYQRNHSQLYVRAHMEEKDIERIKLVGMDWNPFIVGVVNALDDSRNLYLMQEAIPCGTLHSLIQHRAPFDSATASFYFSNIVCALAFLEKEDIVHRDIKPENILVARDGYLVLTDFGSSSKADDLTNWLSQGTPIYMSPEGRQDMPLEEELHLARDWWASGCVLYEMVTRKVAFYQVETFAEAYHRIVKGEFSWPTDIKLGKKLKAIISELLTVDAEKRLGATGVEAVYDHPWLENVNWRMMKSRRYIAPIIPSTNVLMKTWQAHPLPKSREVPGLNVIYPSIHHAHDNRFPEPPMI